MVAVISFARFVENQKLRPILIHGDFFENDIFFHREIVVAQSRTHHVGQQIENAILKTRQNAAVINGVFFGRKRVVARAHFVELAVDIFRTSSIRAFEHHVFQKVRHAVNLRRFVTRTRLNEKTRRH